MAYIFKIPAASRDRETDKHLFGVGATEQVALEKRRKERRKRREETPGRVTWSDGLSEVSRGWKEKREEEKEMGSILYSSSYFCLRHSSSCTC